ncbi:hypothetical protein [Azohydromonas australica]|uniref:hypothetical protein n=1 Tax=Azohydromonas australica TaxID=364039 RepID=UPI0004136488|nr:hypothetical protein [Azohydromonas australica]
MDDAVIQATRQISSVVGVLPTVRLVGHTGARHGNFSGARPAHPAGAATLTAAGTGAGPEAQR